VAGVRARGGGVPAHAEPHHAGAGMKAAFYSHWPVRRCVTACSDMFAIRR
jgi:hypothetical protein